MRDINKTKKLINNIIMIAIILYTLFLIGRIVYAAAMTCEYPNEYREAANIAMTQAICNGENIYSLEAVNSTKPAVCYLYGPLMSLLAAAVKTLLPMLDIPVIHYGISFLSMLLAAWMMSMMTLRASKSGIAAAVSFMMGIFCHWRYGYIYGAPDSFGLCIMISVIYILSGCNEKDGNNRSKAARIFFSPEMAALMTVASFFTKQYFLMIAATGAIYLLFVSRKLFVRYAIAGVAISAIVFGILHYTCPMYLTYAVYFLKGPGAGAAMGKTGIAYNNLQVSYLGGMLLTLFAAVFLYAVSMFWIYIKAIRACGFKTASKEFWTSQAVREIALYFIQLIISAVVLRYIGNNDGAFLSYYLQLFTPALVVIACVAVSKVDFKLLGVKSAAVSIMLMLLTWSIFVGYTIYKVEPRLIINQLSDEEMQNWQRAYEIADAYITEERNDIIYYVPPMNFHGYKYGQDIYNDGQPFVFTKKFLEKYYESDSAQKFFPHAGEVIASHLEYREGMRQRILAGDYELVMYIEKQDPVFTEEELAQKYELFEIVPLRTGNWAWDVQFWVRK